MAAELPLFDVAVRLISTALKSYGLVECFEPETFR